MKRRDFLKFTVMLPAFLLVRRLSGQKAEPPATELDATEDTQPIENWSDDEELSFETQYCFSGPLPHQFNGYPHKVKLSKRIRYTWEEFKWKLQSRLHGEDYWDDDY